MGMGTTIKLTSPDSHSFSAYRADPKSRSKGGIVVVQEIFGVSAHIQSVCDFYASKGYTAIAPAVYDRVERGYAVDFSQDAIAKGAAIAGKLSPAQTLMDMKTAADAARPEYRGANVGVVGYCFGGTMAAAAAINLADTFTSAVAYYGGGIGDLLGDQPKIPLLCHFGKKDPYIPNKIVKKIRGVWTTAIVHAYPADHGFNRDGSPTYHQAAARKAAKRSLDFFALTLSQK
jgi:carboxymethylenebutenolidase